MRKLLVLEQGGGWGWLGRRGPRLIDVQMIVWGIISAATAGVTNYAGLLAVRFFLGFVEAAYFVSFPSRIMRA